MPPELWQAMTPAAWNRFAWEMNGLVKRFWTNFFAFAPFVVFIIFVMPAMAWVISMLALQDNEHELVASDGSLAKPYCSWNSSCVWTAGTEMACTSQLCRSAGFNHGMFISTSNDMCRSSYKPSFQPGTYLVQFDMDDGLFGPFQRDSNATQGLALITADCVRRPPAPAWIGLSIMGFAPFILLCSLCPLYTIHRHNMQIDEDIRELVARTNREMNPGQGSMEYVSAHTGLCKARGCRAWRVLISRGDASAAAAHMQAAGALGSRNETAPLTVPLVPLPG